MGDAGSPRARRDEDDAARAAGRSCAEDRGSPPRRPSASPARGAPAGEAGPPDPPAAGPARRGAFDEGSLPRRAFFGPGARLHHVGVAVPSIRAVDPALGVVSDARAGVSMAFLNLYGVTLELLEPFGEASPIARSVREGRKLLHLCYEVPDLDGALAEGRRWGFHRVREPEARPVYGGRRVAWVFSRNYGLFELLERPE